MGQEPEGVNLLEGLQVEIEDPGPPDSDTLLTRLYQRIRGAAPKRRREAAEPLQWGDQILCDMVALGAGLVIPGGSRQGISWELKPFPNFPGLAEALVGQPSAGRDCFEIRLPEDYPVPWLAGREVCLDFEVREAWQLEMPQLDDPAALRAAGLGEELEQALREVAAEIDEERGEELLVEATNSVLDALCERVLPEVSDQEVLSEVESRWQAEEEPFLRGRGFSEVQIRQALEAAMENPLAQADALRRLRIQKSLARVTEEHSLVPDRDQTESLLTAAADRLGISLSEASRAVATEDGALRSLAWTAQHLCAVEFVMSRAKVEVR